jgi:1-deoxy-D-xylulose-5-phosphate reductoisomerase
MKKIFLFGCSGSIGTQTINIIQNNPDKFKLVGVSINTNIPFLDKLLNDFKTIQAIVITDNTTYIKYKDKYKYVYKSYSDAIFYSKANYVINAVVGYAGLDITMHTIAVGINLGLANKESIVVGGELIYEALKHSRTKIYPIDSEHSAIFQCLKGERKADIKNIVLTASGGPFINYTDEQIQKVTIQDALKHPTWTMGNKITIDSATMLNKTLEMIEAYYLFSVDYKQIKVLIHPQSIVHSLVEFVDGTYKATLSSPDMRIPIQYALSYPNRLSLDVHTDFSLKDLHFINGEPANNRSIALGYYCLEHLGVLPAVLNCANEVAVQAFLDSKIQFSQIIDIVEKVTKSIKNVLHPTYSILKEKMEEAIILANELIAL